jgi:hypothetical protein
LDSFQDNDPPVRVSSTFSTIQKIQISYQQVLFRYNTNVGEFPRMNFLFNSKPNGSCNWDCSISLDNSSTSSMIENFHANSGVHCSSQPLAEHGQPASVLAAAARSSVQYCSLGIVL